MAGLETGARLGQYVIMEQIGQGGMATIYRARQESLGRDVAIKVLPTYLAADPEFLARFRREATAIARLQHPNILPVYDFGEQDGQTYIVMLLAPSLQTLRDRLGEPIDLASAVRIISQVAAALAYAHEQGIIHRDVKPSNVLMGEREWALLSDFGIARMVQGNTHITRTGVGIGTPEYMSPEQGQGHQVDGRADQYSLGIILYQMLTGKLPFEAPTPVAVVIQHITKTPEAPRLLNPSIPPLVEDVMLRAMAKDPNDRYPSMTAFADALRYAADPSTAPVAWSQPTSAVTVLNKAPTSAPGDVSTNPSLPAIPPKKKKRSRAPLFALAGVLLLLLVCAGTALAAGPVVAGSGFFALITASGPTATPTVPPPTPTPVTPTPTEIVIGISGAEPTATPTATETPEPTATPTETSTPRPTNTAAPRPTNTTAPQPTNTTAPRPTNTPKPEPTDTAPPQPTHTAAAKATNTPAPKPTNTTAPSGGGTGSIVVRNNGSATVTCSWNGDVASDRLEVAPGSSGRVNLPAGSYSERCVGGSASGAVVSVNVPAGGSISRTFN